MKAKLSSAEKELEEKNGQLKQLKANYDEQTKSLKQDIIEVTSTFKVKKGTIMVFILLPCCSPGSYMKWA